MLRRSIDTISYLFQTFDPSLKAYALGNLNFAFDSVSSGQNYSKTEVIINAKLLSFVYDDQI